MIKEILLETTADLPKHTYYIDDTDRMVGYIKEGETEVHYFSKPLQFSKKHRKFKKLAK